MDAGQGPFVSAACFCEQVIIGKDDVVTLVRLVDRRLVIVHGAEGPDEMPPQKFDGLSLFIALKPGAARGRHSVDVKVELPSGEYLPQAHRLEVFFEAPDRGQNLVIGVDSEVSMEGLYWFDVFLDETQLLSRVPFRFVYQRFGSR